MTKITLTEDSPIKGYSTPSPEQINLVNENKILEEICLRQIDRLELTNSVRNPQADPRWLAVARTDLQKGFMELNRAVMQPARIGGELNALPIVAFLSCGKGE